MSSANHEVEIASGSPEQSPSSAAATPTSSPFQFTLRDIFHWTFVVAVLAFVTRGNWAYFFILLGVCAVVSYGGKCPKPWIPVLTLATIVVDKFAFLVVGPWFIFLAALFFLGRRHY